jgi:hypothetical protein
MRRAIVLALAVAALVVAAPAGAAKGPTLKSLQTQINVLKKQVKTLKTREATDRNLAIAGIVYTGCTLSVVADAVQGTWLTVDGYVTGAGHAALFGAQTPVNDYQTCGAFNITRAKSPTPPTVAVIQALIDVLFKG